MKTVHFKNENGETVKFARIKSFKNPSDKDFILRTFANNSDVKYMETNVRRYTSGDIYAGRHGVMI